GEKKSKAPYSDEDMVVFSVLAGQAAMAIENAQYYDDLKRTHEQLFQAEKLAYVGQLASSVVHEIRNPLTTIETFLNYLPQKYQESEFREKFERLIPQEIGRLKRLANQLLGLTKQRRLNLTTVNAGQCMDAALELLSTHLDVKKIKVKKDYSPGALTVNADYDQLKQVFINLFLNAIQAMREGDELIIGARVQGSGNVKPHTLNPKPPISIYISDTGPGIAPEQLARLFTPFHTTKEDGIGLGLSITKEIVEQHGGRITVESEVGKGTRFVIELPAN
ncbi:MAG: ATP-binding protein, partial [Candidatus Omnitrophota bacterium]